MPSEFSSNTLVKFCKQSIQRNVKTFHQVKNLLAAIHDKSLSFFKKNLTHWLFLFPLFISEVYSFSTSSTDASFVSSPLCYCGKGHYLQLTVKYEKPLPDSNVLLNKKNKNKKKEGGKPTMAELTFFFFCRLT